MTNPYLARHLETELAFTGDGYTPEAAKALVEREFANGPQPMACGCGGRAYYKPTVGALKCPDCGNLYGADGRLI